MHYNYGIIDHQGVVQDTVSSYDEVKIPTWGSVYKALNKCNYIFYNITIEKPIDFF